MSFGDKMRKQNKETDLRRKKCQKTKVQQDAKKIGRRKVSENKNTARGKENRQKKSKEEKKSTARDIKELIITIRVHICIGI